MQLLERENIFRFQVDCFSNPGQVLCFKGYLVHLQSDKKKNHGYCSTGMDIHDYILLSLFAFQKVQNLSWAPDNPEWMLIDIVAIIRIMASSPPRINPHLFQVSSAVILPGNPDVFRNPKYQTMNTNISMKM